MSNRISISECADLLKQMDDILILTHKSPDGDTIGSAYGLLGIFHLLGKKAKVICTDNIPNKYNYFTEKILSDDISPKFIVSVDIADTTLLGESLEAYADKIDLAIDHHISHRDFAKNIFLDAKSAANTENIFMLAKELSLKIDKDIANALYTGISTDTGCFKYQNVTSKTHIIAGELVDMGIDNANINKIMFDTKTKERLCLELMAMSSIEYYFDNKCSVITVTNADIEKSGANEEDFGGISALPRMIEGVEVGVTIKEKADGYKLSLRSNNYVNVSEICQKLGGGGDRRAHV